MTTLYGIKNCDTVRKARKWLEAQDITFTFHDFRADGLDETTLRDWDKQLSWEILLNRRGTTWRKLPEAERENIDAEKAIQLMLANNTLIKRPVLVHANGVHIGFKPETYAEIFGQAI